MIENGKRKVDSLELRSFSQLVGRSVAFFLDAETATAEAQPLVELIDSDACKQLERAKVTDLLVQVGRSIPRFEISKFPVEYVDNL